MSNETDVRCLHQAAKQMSRQCRHIVQGCLREEEWLDADAEFYAVIMHGLQELWAREGRSQIKGESCSR